MGESQSMDRKWAGKKTITDWHVARQTLLLILVERYSSDYKNKVYLIILNNINNFSLGKLWQFSVMDKNTILIAMIWIIKYSKL